MLDFSTGEGRRMGKDENIESHYEQKGFDLSKYKGIDKMKTIRNCVEPEVGKYILNCSINNTLF
jgi:hypothetical protein